MRWDSRVKLKAEPQTFKYLEQQQCKEEKHSVKSKTRQKKSALG